MRTVTLASLKEQILQQANMEETQLIGDAELVGYINSSIAELHDILVQVYNGDYFQKDYSFTTVTNQDKYDLPADFYKLVGVDYVLGPRQIVVLNRFNFRDRFKDETFAFYSFQGFRTNIRYRLEKDSIRFNTVPDAGKSMRLWYIPCATKLVNDSDTYDGINGYEEYVINDCVIKCLIKEESDVSVQMARKQAFIFRIQSAADNRDTAAPEVITDVYARTGGNYGEDN